MELFSKGGSPISTQKFKRIRYRIDRFSTGPESKIQRVTVRPDFKIQTAWMKGLQILDSYVQATHPPNFQAKIIWNLATLRLKN